MNIDAGGPREDIGGAVCHDAGTRYLIVPFYYDISFYL